jgi:hypothetical protein
MLQCLNTISRHRDLAALIVQNIGKGFRHAGLIVDDQDFILFPGEHRAVRYWVWLEGASW